MRRDERAWALCSQASTRRRKSWLSVMRRDEQAREHYSPPRAVRHGKRGPAGRRRSERGVGTVLTAGVCALLLVVASSASVVVVWVSQVSSAQNAADLAALAGAGAQAEGGDACAAAGGAAVRNEAHLLGCRVLGDDWSFVVEVRVGKELHPRLPGAPVDVERQASAGTLQ